MAEPRSKPKTKDTAQAILVELDLHKMEFASIRAEILHWMDNERQYLNFNLIALGAGLGIIPLLIEQGAFFVMLIFPLVFHILLWEALRAVQNTMDLSIYLTENLIPRVNLLLDELGAKEGEGVVLGWEFSVATRPLKPANLFFEALTPTRHWTPILSIAAMVIAYLVLANTYGYTLSLGEIGLILLNLVFLVMAGFRNIQMIPKAKRQGESVKRFLERQTPDKKTAPPEKGQSPEQGKES